MKSTRVLLSVAATFIYIYCISYFAQKYIYPGTQAIESEAYIQIGIYLVSVLPFILLAPRLLMLYRVNFVQLALCLIMIIFAVIRVAFFSDKDAQNIYLTVITLAITAFAEELIFRGYLWQKLLALTNRASSIIVYNTLLFVAIHIPLVLYQNLPSITLVYITLASLILCLARYKTRNLTLPGALHMFINSIT